ncbi:MAG TPA: hypothetical protein VHD33_00025 [Legionellaceae bacterium]|nr:hypothetical protein [Legionellaceae bacterium]
MKQSSIFLLGIGLAFIGVSCLINKGKMTKEEQLAEFGMEIPENLLGYIKNRTPSWNKEYIEKVMEVAQEALNGKPADKLIS